MITHYFEPPNHQLQTFAEYILAMCNAFEFRNVHITCYSDHFYLKVNAEGQMVEVHFISEDKHLPFKLFINGAKFHVTDALQFGKIMQAYIDRTI